MGLGEEEWIEGGKGRGGERERISATETGWGGGRRETGNTGGRKCTLMKGQVQGHCVTETQS